MHFDFGALSDFLNVLTFQKPSRVPGSGLRMVICLIVVALVVGAAIYFAPAHKP